MAIQPTEVYLAPLLVKLQVAPDSPYAAVYAELIGTIRSMLLDATVTPFTSATSAVLPGALPSGAPTMVVGPTPVTGFGSLQ